MADADRGATPRDPLPAALVRGDEPDPGAARRDDAALAARGLRLLAARPPGTGESERALEDVSWQDWRAAAAAAFAASGAIASVSCAAAPCSTRRRRLRWRFAPATGASLARDLARPG
jgi:hypothetical protein